MASFRTGTSTIPQGATEVSVTGLSLGFTPTVTVSVRQPAGDAGLVTAYVAGTPTSDGFTAVLSASVPQTGYYLDYVAFESGTSPAPTEGDTLQVSYTDLKNEVSRFLGYNAGSMTAAQTSEVDGYIQSGIRQFYYPTAADGTHHEWSFMKLNGSVTTAAGVASYTMPDGFGHVVGQLVYGDAQALTTVPVVPYGDVARNLASNPDGRARPRIAAFASVAEFGTRGQKKKLYLFPTPDAAYTLNFCADADRGKLDATTHFYPLGGPMFGELIIESCLAIAEQKANDEQGAHTAKFQQMMASMVSRDRGNAAQVYGRIGDQEGFRW